MRGPCQGDDAESAAPFFICASRGRTDVLVGQTVKLMVGLEVMSLGYVFGKC